MKTSIRFVALMLFLSFCSIGSAQQFLSHDFNNGNFGPYEVNKSDQRSRVYIRNGAIETHWEESKYDGTNSGRKAQFRPIGWDPNNWQDGFYFQKELWMGFDLKVGTDYMRNNTNADACFMQIWGNQGSNLGNHYAMLKFDGRNGGELTWYNRWCCGSANEKHWLVKRGFPRNRFVSVIIHVNLSSNGSAVRIWLDGDLALSTSGQRMGWGELNASGQINNSYSTLSMGQYNYRENPGTGRTYYDNAHYFNGHMNNETRTVTYDNISLYNGSNGYNRVDPSNGDDTNTGGGGTTSGNIVHMRKRNANGFAIDGNGGGANAQNIYIWAQNSGNSNQQWVEIDRGGGYYSYQKRGTNYCIDGGRGGANGQNVYLWTCGTGNQNQHWRKANMGSGNYRLEKRNASGFSLDGGRGGANRQNLYLWANNNANQNQHWSFSTVGSAKSLGPQPLSEFISVFPNPMVDTFSVDIAELESAKVSMYSPNGKLIFEETVDGGLSNFTLNNVTPGLYLVQIEAGTQLLVKKMLKK